MLFLYGDTIRRYLLNWRKTLPTMIIYILQVVYCEPAQKLAKKKKKKKMKMKIKGRFDFTLICR
jgi:hypothetical protein